MSSKLPRFIYFNESTKMYEAYELKLAPDTMIVNGQTLRLVGRKV